MALDTNSYAAMANQDPIQAFLDKQKKKKMASEPNPISKESPNVTSQAEKTADTMSNAMTAPATRVDPVAQAFVKSTPQTQMQVIAASAPEEAKTVVDNMPGDDSVKMQVKKMFDDPKKLQQQQMSIQTKQAQGQPMGMVDSFVDALTFFLPTALGAAIGAIGGGNEGGAAGAKVGTDLGDAYRQFGLDRAKMAQQQQLNAQQMLLQQQQAEYYQQRALAAGENVDLRKQEILNAQQRLELERQREGRLTNQGTAKNEATTRKQDLADRMFEFTKAKAGQLSDTQVKDIGELTNVKNQLDSFSLDTLNSTGPVEGRIKTLASNMGLSTDAKFEDLKAGIGATLANYIKSMSGTAASDREVARLQSILPSVQDNNLQFITKLNRFKNELGGHLDTKFELITKGQPLKAATVKKLKEAPTKSVDSNKVNNFRKLLGN